MTFGRWERRNFVHISVKQPSEQPLRRVLA